jgi:hypothetical protein
VRACEPSPARPPDHREAATCSPSTAAPRCSIPGAPVLCAARCGKYQLVPFEGVPKPDWKATHKAVQVRPASAKSNAAAIASQWVSVEAWVGTDGRHVSSYAATSSPVSAAAATMLHGTRRSISAGPAVSVFPHLHMPFPPLLPHNQDMFRAVQASRGLQ